MSDEITKIIKERRSIFPVQFTKEPINEAELLQILDAAQYAPNHKMTYPWRFKIIRNKAKKRFLNFLPALYQKISGSQFNARKYTDIQEKIEFSDTIILICMQKDGAGRVEEWEELAATAMAVQNMWLMATSLQIGGYWGSPPMIKHMDEFIKMEKDERCLGIFYMGKVPAEVLKEKPQKPINTMEYHPNFQFIEE